MTKCYFFWKIAKGTFHRKIDGIIEKFVHDLEKFDEASMKRRWSFNDGIFDAIRKCFLTSSNRHHHEYHPRSRNWPGNFIIICVSPSLFHHIPTSRTLLDGTQAEIHCGSLKMRVQTGVFLQGERGRDTSYEEVTPGQLTSGLKVRDRNGCQKYPNMLLSLSWNTWGSVFWKIDF